MTREEALRILHGEHRVLLECFDSLPEGEAQRPGSIGGGDWSAKDLLGHITTWEEVALGVLEDWRAGRPPRIEELIEGPAGTDRFNADQVEKKKAQPLAELRSRAEAVHRTLGRAIETLTDQEWTTRYEQSRHRLRLGEDLGAVLGAPDRPFGHASAHLPDLKALGRSGEPG